MTPPRSVRCATPSDLPLLQAIEAAGDEQFAQRFGPEPFGPDSATDGAERATAPGFVLVVAEEEGGAPVGFAHVLELSDPVVPEDAHLEQIAVLPDRQRRGHGRALIDAAAAEARRRGYARLTLRTYADVPWNRPAYEACGFEVIAAIDSPLHRTMIATEERLGMFAHGDRVLMARTLHPEEGGS